MQQKSSLTAGVLRAYASPGRPGSAANTRTQPSSHAAATCGVMPATQFMLTACRRGEERYAQARITGVRHTLDLPYLDGIPRYSGSLHRPNSTPGPQRIRKLSYTWKCARKQRQHVGVLRVAPASAPPAGSTARAHTAPPSESLTARGRRCARSHSTSSPAERQKRLPCYNTICHVPLHQLACTKPR